LIEDKFHRTLESNELNEYSISGVKQLLKIYSNDEKIQTKTTQNEDTHVVKSDNLSVSPNEDKKKRIERNIKCLRIE